MLFFPKIIRAIKSKKMEWEMLVADVVQMEKECRIRVGELEGRSLLENLGADGKKINFKGIRYGDVDHMYEYLSQDRFSGKRL